VIVEIVKDALAAENVREFQDRALARLLRAVNGETGLFWSLMPTARGFSEARLSQLERDRARWTVELEPLLRRAERRGGTVGLGPLDRRPHVLLEEAMPYHALVANVSFHTRRSGFVVLGCKSRRPAAVARIRATLPALGLAHAALLPGVYAGQGARPHDFERRFAQLTRREQQIARLIGFGYRNREIGQQLGTSPNTVRKQLQRIFDRFGTSSRTELAVWVAGSSLAETE
jgi:DNA-binding CsgD family transcriptional regulator